MSVKPDRLHVIGIVCTRVHVLCPSASCRLLVAEGLYPLVLKTVLKTQTGIK